METKGKYSAFAIMIIFATVLGIIVLINARMQLKGQVDSSGQSTEIKGIEIPEATGYFNDISGEINQEMRWSIEGKLKEFAELKKGEIAVLVVKTTGDMSIEEYGIRVAEKWKVGNEGADDGVIIILATQDRKVRIELGKGAPITSAQAGKVIDEQMIPSLKNSDWSTAIASGADGLITLMSK
ncbi:MAG: TPM domain-containing protein [Candidatus Izemoplasmatales bacterium]|jgi:uncharacterized protein|nr:TPM domain-containing protein [Candidatus Izemoplasmatales bacterium]